MTEPFSQIGAEDAGTEAVVLEEWARALHQVQLVGASVELWAVGSSGVRQWMDEVAAEGEALRRVRGHLGDIAKVGTGYSNGASACMEMKDLRE